MRSTHARVASRSRVVLPSISLSSVARACASVRSTCNPACRSSALLRASCSSTQAVRKFHVLSSTVGSTGAST